jgi:hypothetical protein
VSQFSLVIGTSRTVGSAKKFVRITSGFGGGEFTKTLRKVCTRQKLKFSFSLKKTGFDGLQQNLQTHMTPTVAEKERLTLNDKGHSSKSQGDNPQA